MKRKAIYTYTLIVMMLVAMFSPPLSVNANIDIRPSVTTKSTDFLSAAYVSPDLPTEGEQLVSIIVELQQQPIVVEKYETESKGSFFPHFQQQLAEYKLDKEQDEFFQYIEENDISATILESYQTVFNGITIEVKANEIPLLSQLDVVKGIYPVVTYQVVDESSSSENVSDPIAEPVLETNQPIQSKANVLIGVPELTELGLTGDGVKVGVLDTGIDYHHPDLAAVFQGGYDFVDNDNDPYETTPTANKPNQQTTHGTHVAGIIAGQAIQENGMLGVAPNVELYVYRVLGPGGVGRSDSIIAAVEKAVEDEMDIINLSLGNFLNDSDHPTAVALNHAMLAGTLAVAAAGNSGPNSWTVGSPGTSTMALTVGATSVPEPQTEELEEIWDLSSRGPVKKSLQLKPDLMAPGVSIRSTIAAYENDYTNAYEFFDGTSMATPHVVGVAALLKQAFPDLSAFDLKALLMNNAKRLGDTGQYMLIDQGAGRIQASKAYHAPFLAQIIDQISFLHQGNIIETEHMASSISFGEVTLEKSHTLEKTIEISSLVDETQELTLTTEFLNENHEGISINTVAEEQTLEPQGNLELQVQVNVDHEKASSGKYEGYILITNEHSHSIHLPFLLFVGEFERAKGFEKITVSPTDFSKNVNTEMNINIQVNSEMQQQELLISDGEQFVGQIFSYFGESVLTPGTHHLNWDGKYYDFQSKKTKILADGYYTLDFLGWDEQTPEEQPYLVSTDLYMKSSKPQIVYSEATTIELEKTTSTYVINGKIEDMYIDLGQPEKLTGQYQLQSKAKPEVAILQGQATVTDNGDFSIELKNLTNSNYTFSLVVEDTAGNVSDPLQITFKQKVVNPPVKSGGGGGGFIPTPQLPLEEELKPEPTKEEIIEKPIVQPINAFKDYVQLKKITWATPAIERLVNLQVLAGYNGHFYPEKPMTREEFAKVIVSVLDLHQPVTTNNSDTITFTDIQDTRWSAPFISIATENGLLEGKRVNGKLVFDPQTPITRAEMAVILTRAFNLELSVEMEVSPFTDAKGHWAEKYIYAVYQQGLVNGKSPTTYVPNQQTTRAEMAVFLTRVLDFKK